MAWPKLRPRSTGPTLALAFVALLVAAATALAVTGQLTQLSGQGGCTSETGSGGICADGRALVDSTAVAVSPDGLNVYVAAQASDAVAVFRRDTTTGRLAQLAGTAGCISEDGSGGACTDGKALQGPRSVALSADGKSVYVGSYGASNAVAVFRRSLTSGRLTQLPGTAGCISEYGGVCTDGRALIDPFAVTVSGDGTSVYAAGAAVTVFRRDTTTGALTQLAGPAGCVSETASPSWDCTPGRAVSGAASVAVSPDGKHVYVGAGVDDAVAIFRRDLATGRLTQAATAAGCVSETGSGGTCTDGKALEGAYSVTVSADGENVYAASLRSKAVAVFSRNATSGALSQLPDPDGCVQARDSAGECRWAKALGGARSVAMSPDDKNVYVAASVSDAISILARNTATGALAQVPGTAGCVSQTGRGGTCLDGKALDGAAGVGVSPDGLNVYAVAIVSDAVAAFRRERPPDRTAPAFAGLNSATTCIPGPIGGGTTSSYHLRWDPATDDVTPSSRLVYDVYQATAPGGEDFSVPTYTTPAGATSFDTPPFTADKTYYFVVRARDEAGNRDSNTVERAGENLCV